MMLAEKAIGEREVMPRRFAISIDGPVAAGKGTIASLLSEQLNGFYLYSGGMYRALALYCLRNSIDVNKERLVEKALLNITTDLLQNRVLLNGEDITERIKEKDVASSSSKLAIFSGVRAEMVRRQQEIAKIHLGENKIVVAEGRDAATRIIPDASFKVFLTAREEVRAQRRLDQFREQGDDKITFEKVLEQIRERDKRDLEREVDPLVREPEKFGYWILDNSDMTEKETIDAIIKELRKRNLINDSD